MRDTISKKIPTDFHNRSNYGYHFIIKEFAEEFKTKFICLGENTETYLTFIVPIAKDVTRTDENGEKVTKKLFYIFQLIDSPQFMASSLSNLINNIFEGIRRIKCKFGHDQKKVKHVKLDIIIGTIF